MTTLMGSSATGTGCVPPREDLRAAVLALGPTPAEYLAGDSLFHRSCAQCHGPRATGTSEGPPLVHPVYEPGHHGDQAFQIAVAQGVRAHHWRFGHMPPVEGVSPGEVDRIVGYVRWLQREVGID